MFRVKFYAPVTTHLVFIRAREMNSPDARNRIQFILTSEEKEGERESGISSVPIKAVPGNRFSLNLSMIRIDKNEMWRMDPASTRSQLCSLSSSRFESLFFSRISFYNNKLTRSLRSRWIVKARIMKRILNSCCTQVARISLFYFIQVSHDHLLSPPEDSQNPWSLIGRSKYIRVNTFSAFL